MGNHWIHCPGCGHEICCPTYKATGSAGEKCDIDLELLKEIAENLGEVESKVEELVDSLNKLLENAELKKPVPGR